MDGVFMKKFAKIVGTLCLLLALAWLGTVIADRQNLNENLIRLHVVGASNSAEDQSVKLKVRDAVVKRLEGAMQDLPDAKTAKAYILSQLQDLKETADKALAEAGVQKKASVAFQLEEFSTRKYDTFTLPAGVYESLRITIGEGEGENWWCVVFPSLCLPATTEGFADAAAGADFPDSLTGALQNQGGYEIRFFFLDCLGWLDNLLHR